MGANDERDDAPAWGGAIQSAIDEVSDEEDGEPLNVVSTSGLTAGSTDESESGPKDLPYVVLLNAAVSMLKSGEISETEFVEGVKKLDNIADGCLKVYAIPAVKNDLPGKLSEYQNEIVNSLEVQIYRLKEGLALLLGYPASKAIDDLETGLQIAVQALNESANIQKKADAERAAILQREKEEKAQRHKKAAAAEDDSDSDSDA